MQELLAFILLTLGYNYNEYIMDYYDLQTRFESRCLPAVYYSTTASELAGLDIGT